MFLSLTIFPFLLLITIHIQKIQNKYYKFKYFNSSLVAFFGFLFLLSVNHDKIELKEFIFLKDYKFYLAQLIAVFFIIIQIKARKLNENNLTIVYFIGFLSISITPFSSIFLMYVFNFQNTIEVEYKSFYHVIGLSISLIILSILFFLNKLKNRNINGFKVLFLSFLLGSFVSVFSSKLMQEYNAINYMISASVINFSIFIIFSLVKEIKGFDKIVELKNLIIVNKKSFLFMTTGYCIMQVLNIFIINNIAAEHYSIIKTIGFVFANYFYSYYIEKINIVNYRDSTILLMIILALLFFTF